ncbi:MBL fold metallo-hydrolase [Primorskyibacter sp. S187A]|uniref:MBL fold metallo-hydrolase n=1 Tax=Primorskyibacter sp. S187A TaxID=3415130 RepID=UPI003C7AFDB9
MLPPAPPRLFELAPDIRRLIAPNPSPMTYWGTNTYLLGQRDVAVIDPGPTDATHCKAILDAVPSGGSISHIFVTHAHLDHSPGARDLAQATGAMVHAFGPATAGRSEVMTALATEGFAGGGEGVDDAFIPDVILEDAQTVSSRDWDLTALHTPGHMGNHLSFAWNDLCFCGDLVMAWSSSLVSPPDGDLTDFMASCERLKEGAYKALHPGHGLPIEDPAARLDWLIQHRKSREQQILSALTQAPGTAEALAARIYTDIPPNLLPAAARNVFAHLIDLTGKAQVAPTTTLRFDAVFAKSKS